MAHQTSPEPGIAAVFGAPLDSGNLGVSALGLSTLHGLHARLPDLRLTLFDNGRGRRRHRLDDETGSFTIEQRGAWLSRRLHRPESLWSMDAASRTLPWFNPNVRLMRRSDVVLDISGGDSFTDLYGPRRFHLVTLPKLIALRVGRPLILLPQTYGPFRSDATRDVAATIVRASGQAWARDADSFEQLKDLAGDRFDPTRHRLGVDVAFALPRREPSVRGEVVDGWLTAGTPPIGLNISGLLYHRPQVARERFGLRLDYAEAMQRTVRTLLDRTDERIVLVPHVFGERESDVSAADDLARRFGEPERLAVLPRLDADEVKSVVSRLSWFAGARMHTTIAALSSGVPAAAVAYSDKFHGVFAGCGLGDRVLDARKLGAAELAEALVQAYGNRSGDRARLTARLPSVRTAVEEQLDSIADLVAGARQA